MTNKLNILFLNHKEKACGIYQYGLRSANILKQSKKYNFIYIELNSEIEYKEAINIYDPIGIIYNYNPTTMFWTNSKLINNYNKIVHYGLHHEGVLPDDKLFNYLLYVDPTHIETIKTFAIGRPLFNTILSKQNKQNDLITINSFGFGFEHKCFEKIIELVNNQFNEAIINLHISTSFYGDQNGERSKGIIKRCVEGVKQRIKLNITNNFLSDEEILQFLSLSDINIFLYDKLAGGLDCGVSSVIDYALSVEVPLAISNSLMFRHINDKSICIDNNSIQTIINNKTNVINLLRQKWSNANFIEKYEQIITLTIL